MESKDKQSLYIDGNGASVISYNVPEPSTYSGNKYVELDLTEFSSVWYNSFKEYTNLPFQGRAAAINKLSTLSSSLNIQDIIKKILTEGYTQTPLKNNITGIDLLAKFIYLPSNFEGINKVQHKIKGEIAPEYSMDISPQKGDKLLERVLNPRDSLYLNQYQSVNYLNDHYDTVADRIKEGNFLVIFRNLYGFYDFKYVPIPEKITPRIFLIEKYKLSNFLGNYGVGKTVKTFSLLPGEKTEITIKTFRKTSVDSKQSSSILDSFTKESSDDFENTLNNEQSNKTANQDKFAWHVEAEADASFGFGSAKIKGGASGENASQREDMAKSVSNAVQKHSQKASAKRDIHVDTSYEVKEETGEETSIKRTIENINVSRTLNFVFRQMNQEFISILHLVDAKIGYSNGLPGSFAEESITKMDEFLKNILTDDSYINDIKQGICNYLSFIIDYKGVPQSFITPQTYKYKEIDVQNLSKKPQEKEVTVLKTKNNLVTTYKSSTSETEKKVQGIILSVMTNVMRTEGILVEALLGQGDALDSYSHGLQDEAVREKRIANSKSELANTIISNNEADKAKLFGSVYPLPSNGQNNCISINPNHKENG